MHRVLCHGLHVYSAPARFLLCHCCASAAAHACLQVWAAFSAVTVYMFYLCMRSARLDPSTPRLVFSWFLASHNVCVAVGAAGYLLFLLELLGLQKIVAAVLGKSTSMLLLWYGLYFGILGRDTAEVAFSGLVRAMFAGFQTIRRH